jgi:hypothetical protein
VRPSADAPPTKPLTNGGGRQESPGGKEKALMADHEELMDVLNEALSLEYTAAIQYNQHSMLLKGAGKVALRGPVPGKFQRIAGPRQDVG